MAEQFYWRAINRALDEALTEDPRVVLFGEDVALPNGVFGVTRNLRAKHGETRVFDAPIAENAFIGAAVGAAMTGLRAVAELMFMDFSLVAADQIINHAAKVRYLSHGQYHVPMVIRAQQGVSPGSSAQHTQSFEHLFTGVPGLKVVAAADPQTAYGLLHSAIRDDDPVLFLEHRVLYMTKGELDTSAPLPALDEARVVRQGRDLTIVSWLRSVGWALHVAELLAQQGVEAEVIDLCSLQPVDYATISGSLARTGRLAVVQEAVTQGGLGAEIAATVSTEYAGLLSMPVVRFGAAFTPMPSAPHLQDLVLPDVARMAAELAARVGAAATTRR
jgi:acetoin:2,6-dichlorophenolindophenol oxidoreductase subunit beta